jgi:hypothetical protein
MNRLFEWLRPTCAVCDNRLRLQDVFRIRFGLGVICPQCHSRLRMPLWVACLTVIPLFWLLDLYPQYVQPLHGGLTMFLLALVVFMATFVFLCMLPVRYQVITRQWVGGLIVAALGIGMLVVVTWIEYHAAW